MSQEKLQNKLKNNIIDFSSNPELVKLVEKEKNKCIGCKLCMRGCPMLDEFCDNPKHLLEELCEKKAFDIKLSSSCMLCGYCTNACPKNVSLENIFLQFRQRVMKEKTVALDRGLRMAGVKLHQRMSFSRVFCKPVSNLQSEYVFFPGCALMSHNPTQVREVYSYLQDKIPGIGYWNSCCGKPTFFLGYEKQFSFYLQKMKAEINVKGVKKIIVACQNCFVSFKKHYTDIEIISLYTLLPDLGLPKNVINKFSDYTLPVNIHDPCPTRNEDFIHLSVRKIIKDLGFEIEELKFSKKNTICCGVGGLVSSTAPTIAHKHTLFRIKDGNKMMITYCRECVSRISAYDRQIVHILDLIFDKMYTSTYLESEYELTSQSLLQSWFNRFKIRRIKNEKDKQ